MAQTIRAKYQNGRLQLLDPIALSEGQIIELMILTHAEKVRLALSDLLVEFKEGVDDDLDEEKMLREIADDFNGQLPLSQTIIDERNEGP